MPGPAGSVCPAGQTGPSPRAPHRTATSSLESPNLFGRPPQWRRTLQGPTIGGWGVGKGQGPLPHGGLPLEGLADSASEERGLTASPALLAKGSEPNGGLEGGIPFRVSQPIALGTTLPRVGPHRRSPERRPSLLGLNGCLAGR